MGPTRSVPSPHWLCWDGSGSARGPQKMPRLVFVGSFRRGHRLSGGVPALTSAPLRLLALTLTCVPGCHLSRGRGKACRGLTSAWFDKAPGDSVEERSRGVATWHQSRCDRARQGGDAEGVWHRTRSPGSGSCCLPFPLIAHQACDPFWPKYFVSFGRHLPFLSCHPRRYYVAPLCQEPWLCHTQLLSPCHSLSSGCSSPWNERDRAELHGSASNQPRDLGN